MPLERSNMKIADRRQLIDDCTECRSRQPDYFCNLSPEVLRLFNGASHQSSYPDNVCLFSEGQMPRGLHILCSGRVKLSTMSREGKILILKLANAGEVLGLSAVISETYYEVTAHTAEPCLVTFIERKTLLRLLGKHGELGFRAAQALSAQFQAAYRDIHDLVLARLETRSLYLIPAPELIEVLGAPLPQGSGSLLRPEAGSCTGQYAGWGGLAECAQQRRPQPMEFFRRHQRLHLLEQLPLFF